MLTPQEVRQRINFEKAVFGGYNMTSVDEVVGTLVEDYTALHKDNAALHKDNTMLKSRIKVLVERLEEYRKKEDSMNRAIITAQQASDEMIADTERKCARMLADTEQAMRQRSAQLKKEINAEAQRVAEARQMADTFIAEMEEQIHQYLSRLEQLKQLTARLDEESEPTTEHEVSRQIGVNLEKIMATAAPQTAADPTMGDTRVIPVDETMGDTRVITPVEV